MLTVNLDVSPELKSMLKSLCETSVRIEQKLDAATQQEKKDMSALSDSIQVLQTNLTAETTIVGGVKTFCESVPKLIADAVAAAVAKGATPAELQSLTDLGAAMQKNSADLAAAIVAGTPGVPVPVPVP